MNGRELLLLTGSAILLGAVGYVVLGPGAVPVAGAGQDEFMPLPAAPEDPRTDAETPTAAASEIPPIQAHVDGRDSRELTAGVIHGTVALSASALPDLKFVTVQITEAINVMDDGGLRQKPFQVQQAYEIRNETPRFHFGEIPFSNYGYQVRALAPGFNGSDVWVQVDEKRPTPPALVLSVTRGVPFSLLLRDQFQSPVADLPVRLVPLGEPYRPPPAPKTADGFGSVVFEDVLAGRWRVEVGEAGKLRNTGTEIEVLSHAGVQSKTVLVPRGLPLTVRVTTYGYGLEGARVIATQTDSTLFRPVEGTTDIGGNLTLAHLPPGTWHVDVEAEGYYRTTRSLVIKEGIEPSPMEVGLLRSH